TLAHPAGHGIRVANVASVDMGDVVVIGDAVDEPVEAVDYGGAAVVARAAHAAATSASATAPRIRRTMAAPEYRAPRRAGDRGASTKGRADFGAKTRSQIVSGLVMSDFVRSYLTVAIFGALAGALVAAFLGLGKALRPTRPTPQKYLTYGSG